jgi:hypothetical protein
MFVSFYGAPVVARTRPAASHVNCRENKPENPHHDRRDHDSSERQLKIIFAGSLKIFFSESSSCVGIVTGSP